MKIGHADGMDHEALIAQKHSNSDDVSHFMALLQYLKDSCYINIDNKPLFLICRSSLLPHSVHITNLWRKLAKENDLDGVYLVKVESFPEDRNRNPQLEGFDASLDYTPDGTHSPSKLSSGWMYELFKRFRLRMPHPFSSNSVFFYSEFVECMLRCRRVDCPRFPCVFPAWDNSTRRKNGGASIIHGSTPSLYGKWLKSVLADYLTLAKSPEAIVFINAWIEWAEGCHLEPDLRWNLAYLEETLYVLSVNST